MKYAIAIVVLAAAIVLGWAVMHGSSGDVWMVAISVIAVIFFSTLPVLLGVVYRRTTSQQNVRDDRTRTIVVTTPKAAPPSDAAHTELDANSAPPKSGEPPA